MSVYFTRYDAIDGWRVEPGLAEGRPALLISDPADPTHAVRYVVLLDWRDGEIAVIRDHIYAPYVMEGVAVTRA